MSKQPLTAPHRSRCEHVTQISGDLTPADVEERRRAGRCHWCQRRDPDLWLCLHVGCALLGCGEPDDHSCQHHRDQPHHCLVLNVTTLRVWCYLCTTEVFLDNNEPPVGGGGVAMAAQDVAMAGAGSSSESDSDDEQPPCGLTGLRNIGNTCYMNAALQALSNLPPLTHYFLDCERLVPVDRKPGLARSYCRLVQQMWDRRRVSCLAPTAVLQALRAAHPQFRGFQQHDSQEFLRCFMDAIHEELRRPAAQKPHLNDGNLSGAGDQSAESADEEDYETADSGVSERSAEPPRRRRRRQPLTQRPPPPPECPADDTSGVDVEFADAECEASGASHSRPPSPEQPQQQRCPGGEPCPAAGSEDTPHRPQYCSIISDVFDGRILSSVQCLTCNGMSATRETFQDLSLPIPGREQLSVLHAQLRAPAVGTCGQLQSSERGWVGWLWDWLAGWFSGPSVSLHDCLASFFSSDELKGDNMYSCGRCKMLRNGVKFCRVLELPEVLTVHLKRFRHELVFSAKLGTYVQFPLTGLDMAGYLHKHSTSQVTTYNLAAVVCHHGTAGAGHYTAYAQNPDSGAWYEYDDQYVTEVSPETVAACQAYVLFYRKWSDQATQRRQLATELIRRSRGHPSLLSYYISRQWVAKFNTFAEPGPIDNWDFLCRHGGVRPDMCAPLGAACARFPEAGWEYLHASLGGGPVANALYECGVCAAEWEALAGRRRRELAEFRRLQSAGPPAAALAAAWFRRWEAFARGREPQPPGPIDNAGIMVTRNGVQLVRPGSDHVQLPLELWQMLRDIYGGGPELPLVPASASPAQQRRQRDTSESPRGRESTPSPIPEVHRRTRPPAQESDRRTRPLAEEADRRTRPPADEADRRSRPPEEESDRRSRPLAEESDRRTQPPSQESDRRTRPPAEESDRRNRPPAEEPDRRTRPPAEEPDRCTRPPAEESDHRTRPLAEVSDCRTQPPAQELDRRTRPPAQESDCRTRSPAEESDRRNRPPAEEPDRRTRPPAQESDRRTQPPAQESDCRMQPPAQESDCRTRPLAEELDRRTQPPAQESDCRMQPPAQESDCRTRPPAQESDCRTLSPAGANELDKRTRSSDEPEFLKRPRPAEEPVRRVRASGDDPEHRTRSLEDPERLARRSGGHNQPARDSDDHERRRHASAEDAEMQELAPVSRVSSGED